MSDETEIKPEPGAVDVTRIGLGFEIRMSHDGKRKWHRRYGETEWKLGDAPKESKP